MAAAAVAATAAVVAGGGTSQSDYTERLWFPLASENKVQALSEVVVRAMRRQ
jgi:hypothetical protein